MVNPVKNQSFPVRLGFALAGLSQGVRTERSLRVQVVVAAVAILALCVIRPAPVWWALVILSIGAVITAELFNTALEHLIDHLHPGIHPEMRMVKDCSAAAVFVAALAAAGVATAFLLSLIL